MLGTLRLPVRPSRVLLAALVATGLGGATAASTVTAHAYGRAGSMGVYQVGLSFNCDKPGTCGAEGPGGFWGWVELDNASADGLSGHGGDAQLEGCSHGGGFNGAGHVVMDFADWYIAPDADNGGAPTFWGSWTETDTFNGQSKTFTVTDQSTGIPAFSVHRPLEVLLGIPTPPGSSFNVQVAYKPAR